MVDNLGDITAFVRVAERLSFAEAGRDLGLSPSAVGKSVARIETTLGVRLFHRTTRRVSLTEEGAVLHERYRFVLDELREAAAMVSHGAGAPRGLLRITLPTIGYRFLVPVLRDFTRLYPAVDLDLDFNDRLVDLVDGGFDAAIRSGVLTDSSFLSRRLGAFRFVLCAAPGYLERKGIPECPGDLDAHDALRFRFPTTGKLQSWDIGDGMPNVGRAVLTCNNMEAMLASAIEGLGIAYMPDFLAGEAVSDGKLVTLLDRFLTYPGQFSILWPSGRHMSPRLRAFVDFLIAKLFLASPSAC